MPQPNSPGAGYAAVYDAWNRLVRLTDSVTSQTVADYQYDARKFRIVSRTYTNGVISETRHHYYTSGWQCVEERLGTTPDTANPNRQFVWGLRYIDDFILRDRDTGGGTLSERVWGLQDANWNMVAVANTPAAVLERYAYSPYGQPTALTAAYAPKAFDGFSLEFGYCGYRYDRFTGLFVVRNRYLHPTLGNWVSRDPIGYADGMSLYGYVSQSPTVSVDPSGRSGWADLRSLPNCSPSVRTALDEADRERSLRMSESLSWAAPRLLGGVRLVGGASETMLGAAVTLTPSPDPVTKIGGPLIALHGLDTCIAALRQIYSGEFASSFTQQGVTNVARYAGAGEWSETVGTVVDAGAGIGGSMWAGVVTSPSAVAGRVTLADSQRLGQAVLCAGETPVGVTAAYVQPNWLVPNVYTGLSSRAALQAGRPYPILDDETAFLLRKFASTYNYACAEGQCISNATKAAGGLPSGGAISVRAIRTAGEMDACKACSPVIQRLGIFKNASTPKRIPD